MAEHVELIVGQGEIGKAVREAVCPDASVYDLNGGVDGDFSHDYDVMHVCFPFSEDFVRFVGEYMDRWKPKYVAIWSTVPIGTTKACGLNVVHTPVEGKHPKLAKSIKLMPRWVGYNQPSTRDFFSEYFEGKGFEARLVENSDCTEALKLLSTTEYGVNLVYADYKKRVADAIGMDYELTKSWNTDYNELYQQLEMPQFQKFVLDPPNGVIGGHCVRENSILLNTQFHDILLDRIIGMQKP